MRMKEREILYFEEGSRLLNLIDRIVKLYQEGSSVAH
jgi:hypothetical protein